MTGLFNATMPRRTHIMALAAGCILAATMAYAQDDSGPIYFAVASPLTGGSAAYGINAQRGGDLAVEAINAAGGIGGREVVLEYFDDMGTPRESAAVANRIVRDDKFCAVIGHVNSSSTLAAMPIYNEAGISVLNGSSSNPSITEQGWDNIIRMTIRGDRGAQQYSAFAINNLGHDELAIFYVNSDFGRALRDDMVAAVDALGAKVVGEETFTPNVDRDFSAQISSLRRGNPDVIMLNTDYNEGGLFLGQAQDRDFAGIDVVGPDSNLYDQFIELSQGAAEGAYLLAAFDPFADREAVKTFMSDFEEAYDSLPSQVAIFTHDLLWLAKKAIEDEGATCDTLIDTAKSINFSGAGGDYAWDEKGDVSGRTFAVIKVVDGQFVSTGQGVDETGLEALR